MKDIRLVALDLDGTVFDDEKRISPRNMAAMTAALQKGVAVVPATGRNLTGVPQELLDLPGVRYALCSNGAAVYDLTTGQRVVNLPFDAQEAIAIYDTVAPFGGLLSIFINGESYTTRANLQEHWAAIPPALRSYFENCRTLVDDMHATLLQNAHSIEKFSIMYPTEADQRAAREAVTAHHEVEAATSLPRNLELSAPGVHKGRGLLELAAHLGLEPSQVMACGDSGNDLEMLRAAGLGVAMANATDDVKAAADALTGDNNHDGVAEAIERYVL